jgi:tetratricopeptide (TPR) repeat protein/DNA-binding XRE family transcriptional regulator
MSDDRAGFGDLLRTARQAARLSQEELAERSGLSVRAISNLERGRSRWPYPATVHRLADALRLSGSARAEFISAAGRRLARPLAGLNGTGSSWPGPGPGAGSGGSVVPQQLPAPVPGFAGRRAEAAELTARMHAARAQGTAMVVAAIDGTPGIGKTALAVHWAHEVAAEFPDGQLYVNLRGFDLSGEVMPPATVIRGFLAALGVPAGNLPASGEAQAALYRSLLAGKRVLLVLDNARDAGQVRPMLPGSPGCLVVVTSRARLTGLAAAEGAHLLTLDVLPPGAARELLTSRIGAARTGAEPAAVEQMARLCGRLPLALTVAAARAAARPRMPLAAAAAELGGAASRLRALETGDPGTSVRTVFSWSCRSLGELPARMFWLLGVHPGPDITAAAAAALVGISLPEAQATLDALAMANLVEEHVPGRFAFHDLLRAYAAEQAAEHLPAQERHAAIQRVLDHYLHTGHAAALLLNPSREPVALAQPQPGTVPERLADGQQAMAWFEAEHQVLVSVITMAAQTGFDTWAWQLAWAMDNFLDWRGHWQEWAATQRIALAAATRLGDLAGQATARRLLGHTHARQGEYDQARAHLTHCLELYRTLGDPVGEGRVHQTLGWVAERQNRYPEALSHAEQALTLYRATGDQARQAAAVNNVGWCHILTGSYQQAREFCRQAVDLHRRLGDRPGEAGSWNSLGWAEHKLGNLAEAVHCHRQGLAVVRDLGDRYAEAEFLTYLGDVLHTAGDLGGAGDAWQQALDILTGLHHPDAAHVRGKLEQLGQPGQLRPFGHPG